MLQCDVNSVARWCSSNNLFLNLNKTFYVCFTRLNCPIFMEFYVMNRRINQVNEILDLGVIFDSKLTFNSHIDYIIPKAYAVMAFINRHSKEFDDPYVKKILYSSFVRSKLEYALIVWNPTTSVKINRVERIQKKFLKSALSSIHFVQPIPSYESRCKLIHLPTLSSRRQFQSMVFLYKVICGLIDSPYILNRIGFNVPPRRLRRIDYFNIPTYKTNYAINEPIIRCLREFNRLSYMLEIDFSMSTDQFKKLLNDIYY